MSGSTITISGWRPVRSGPLRGYLSVEFPFGLIIRDVSVFSKDGKTWVKLPDKAKLLAGGEGVARRADGKVEYAPVLEWRSRDLGDRFGKTVLELLEIAHPGALG